MNRSGADAVRTAPPASASTSPPVSATGDGEQRGRRPVGAAPCPSAVAHRQHRISRPAPPLADKAATHPRVGEGGTLAAGRARAPMNPWKRRGTTLGPPFGDGGEPCCCSSCWSGWPAALCSPRRGRAALRHRLRPVPGRNPGVRPRHRLRRRTRRSRPRAAPGPPGPAPDRGDHPVGVPLHRPGRERLLPLPGLPRHAPLDAAAATSIDRPRLLEGRLPASDDPGEVAVLDRYAARPVCTSATTSSSSRSRPPSSSRCSRRGTPGHRPDPG